MRTGLFLLLTCAAFAAENSTLVDRVGTTGFVQLEAESFKTLSLNEQTLAYWLMQASIAIDPINYDQNSIWGLRQKALLEEILRHSQGVNSQTLRKITDFTKLFWANRGNHNEMTAQKFLPEFTFDELKAAARTGRAQWRVQREETGRDSRANSRHSSLRCSTPRSSPRSPPRVRKAIATSCRPAPTIFIAA